MLNLIDFSVLLMLPVSFFGGFAAAQSHKAGTASAIFFALLSVAVGVGVGRISSKLAYSVLKSKTLPAWMSLRIYMVIPCVGLLVAFFAPFLLAEIFYG